MKWVKRVSLLVLVALVGLALLQYAASESTGEVVVLTTTDAAGETHETRLWIVDNGGQAWLRAGQDSAGWYARIQQNPRVELTRDGETNAFIAVPQPAATDSINALIREKYTWGAKVIARLIPSGGKVAIRLDPAGG